jgi:hypothetical protein
MLENQSCCFVIFNNLNFILRQTESHYIVYVNELLKSCRMRSCVCKYLRSCWVHVFTLISCGLTLLCFCHDWWTLTACRCIQKEVVDSWQGVVSHRGFRIKRCLCSYHSKEVSELEKFVFDNEMQSLTLTKWYEYMHLKWKSEVNAWMKQGANKWKFRKFVILG